MRVITNSHSSRILHQTALLATLAAGFAGLAAAQTAAAPQKGFDTPQSAVDAMIKNGIVYEKDLGPDSLNVAKGIERYDPDKTWRRTDDEWPADSGTRRQRQLTLAAHADSMTSAVGG